MSAKKPHHRAKSAPDRCVGRRYSHRYSDRNPLPAELHQKAVKLRRKHRTQMPCVKLDMHEQDMRNARHLRHETDYNDYGFSAVEQLISLGADVQVKLTQEDSNVWQSDCVPFPCMLSESGKRHFEAKAKHLSVLQLRIEVVNGIALSLIHLAVRLWPCVLLTLSRALSGCTESRALEVDLGI